MNITSEMRQYINLVEASQSATVGSAVAAKNLQQLNDLIAAGHPVDEPDSDGWVPLHHAVSNDFVAGAEALLVAGADPNRKKRIGQSSTLLGYAFDKGNPAMAKLLVKHGASAAPDDLFRIARGILVFSRADNTEKMLQALVDIGFDINYVFHYHQGDSGTILDDAYRQSNQTAIDWLKARKAKQYKDFGKKHPDTVVKYSGAARNSDNSAALMGAMEWGAKRLGITGLEVMCSEYGECEYDDEAHMITVPCTRLALGYFAVRGGTTDLSAAVFHELAHAYHFAQKLMGTRPLKLADADFNALAAAGFDREDLADINVVEWRGEMAGYAYGARTYIRVDDRCYAVREGETPERDIRRILKRKPAETHQKLPWEADANRIMKQLAAEYEKVGGTQ